MGSEKHTPGFKEWLAEDWTVGQYTPTASFRSIINHACVCRGEDMGLIAITGPAEDKESQVTADLFAAAPQMFDALDPNRLRDIAEGLNSLTDNAREMSVEDIQAVAQELCVAIGTKADKEYAAIAKARGE